MTFKKIDFKESFNFKDYKHAAHCCIFSLNSTKLWKDYESKALISMQMRFDGRLGFPGGRVNEIDIVSGLNRELVEEINLNSKFHATEHDYVYTHLDMKNKQCLHFYAKEVTKENFINIEIDTLKAEDFGVETFGLIRVPVFVMDDKTRGLPSFLKNQFAGSAKITLIEFLMSKKLCSEEDVTCI